MRVIVLGSGVVGVTSAWYLAQAGHQVCVIDRQPGPALETSYANAGQISPGYSSPWAAPGIPVKAIKWMLQDLSPLRISPKVDLNMAAWMTQMLKNCTESNYAINKKRMVRIAEYSRDCFIALRKEIGIEYDDRAQGLTQLFRDQKQMDGVGKDIDVLKSLNVPHQLLNMDQVLEYEPGLKSSRDKFVGGLRLPGDETGNCYEFTCKLAEACAEAGVEFRYNTDIEGLIQEGGDVVGVRCGGEVLKADRYLVSLGSYSPFLVKPLQIKLPIYPVKGYSLTLPIIDPSHAPESTVMDETYKVALTRLGDRIRVGGTAELTGYDLSMPEARRRNIEFVVKDLFPGGGDLDAAEFWTGLRPMTPDGTPVVGATPYPSLYLNTGHGTLGWTMSLGSARLIADLISGRSPDIDPQGLGVERYR